MTKKEMPGQILVLDGIEQSGVWFRSTGTGPLPLGKCSSSKRLTGSKGSCGATKYQENRFDVNVLSAATVSVTI